MQLKHPWLFERLLRRIRMRRRPMKQRALTSVSLRVLAQLALPLRDGEVATFLNVLGPKRRS
jgi:hypothetical protein